jgi:hypothetical protein
MDTPATETEILFEQIEDYTKTSVELLKMQAVEKASGITVVVVSKAGVAIAVLLFMIVFTVGAALLLGDVLGKPYYGFFVVGGVCLIFAVLFHLQLEKWIRKPLGNQIIKKLLS